MRANVNVDGESFRKGETFIVDKVDKVSAVAETRRNSKTYRIPLQTLDLQDAPAGAVASGALGDLAISIVRAQYGLPGGRQANVVNRVRALAMQSPAGESPVILVSESLRGAAANQTNTARITLNGTISQSGNANLSGTIVAEKDVVLTVTYTVNGVLKTVQGMDGEKIILK